MRKKVTPHSHVQKRRSQREEQQLIIRSTFIMNSFVLGCVIGTGVALSRRLQNIERLLEGGA